MERGWSRLAAGALGLAVVGTATGGVIAQADDSAPTAKAAQQGGVEITPAMVEQTAKRGNVGSFTVKNTTRNTLRVTVTVRPWTQNRSTGAVAANLRASLSPYVRASPQTFDLRPGSRSVRLNMRRTTASGSLYGGHPGLRQAQEPEEDQRHQPAVQRDRAPAPEPGPQAAEPARRRHRRRRSRQWPFADPRRAQHRQHAGPGRRHRPHHGSDGPQRDDPAGQRRARAGRLPQGWRAARHEARQLPATWSITQGTKRYTARRTFRL